jgi:hypothetical protein
MSICKAHGSQLDSCDWQIFSIAERGGKNFCWQLGASCWNLHTLEKKKHCCFTFIRVFSTTDVIKLLIIGQHWLVDNHRAEYFIKTYRMSIQQWRKHGIVFALNLTGTLFLSRLRNWQDANFCFPLSIQNWLSSAVKIQVAQQVLEQIMPLLISTISQSGNWITWISNTITWR